MSAAQPEDLVTHYFRISYGEAITKLAFEEAFGKKFAKVRPDWLEGLELDGQNEEESVAFEYNGRQHYEFTTMFHKTMDDFIDQQRRDKKKEELCESKGVILVIVPYTVSFDKIRTFVQDYLKQLGFKPAIDASMNDEAFLERLSHLACSQASPIWSRQQVIHFCISEQRSVDMKSWY